MTRYGFSQRHRARIEARTLPHPHSPNEVPSPCNEQNMPNESAGADESGGQGRATEDDQNLESMINNAHNDRQASDLINNISSRTASPVTTTNADVILAGGNAAKSKDNPDVRQSSNTVRNSAKLASTAIRGGGIVTGQVRGADRNRFTSIPLLLKAALEKVVRDEEYTSGRPTKNWITRFKESQKPINPHRRRKYKTKSPKHSARTRVLRRLEYKNLGIELSYADVKRADWKPQDHMAVDSRISSTRKPKPGCSNLRYCLTYLKQVQYTVSEYRSSWKHRGFHSTIFWLTKLFERRRNYLRFLYLTNMSHGTEVEGDWADKEIANLNQLIAKEVNEMREEAGLTRVSNSHALQQVLTGGQRNDNSKRTDQMESAAETGANNQESELEAAFLKDSDEENEGVEDDGDEDWEEYFDCEEKLSDDDYFLYNIDLREGMSEYINNQAERSSEVEDEPQFAAHLFSNPLQSLEHQENNRDASPPNSNKPNKQSEKRPPQKLSRTWVTRFLAKEAKSRRRRMPRGPGRFIYPSSDNVLLLLMNGININGARPTRGDTELLRHQRHRKSGQYVSFSSPLRHCWTYISCEEETG
ncbi:hypothetical protein BPOR_0119g00190 [Botrytis porri]|uniref:Uncharacterized protein n=1 Tax=Botrytis porri TaxID=87229 RepID=A0A4Z1KXJ5_9HELO|nr:hypothetical protein BPOR_0119g00190 [Botrytis porri]